MKNLIESIVSENYVEASGIFESRLDQILEKKLIEMKKCMQAEATGGDTPSVTAAKIKAGYQPAHKVLGLAPLDKSRAEKEARGGRAPSRKAPPKPEDRPAVDQKPVPTKKPPRLKEPKQEPEKVSASDDLLDRETKVKELQRRGTEAQKRGAGRWLKKTRVSRIAAGVGKHFGSAAKNVVSGLAGLNTME